MTVVFRMLMSIWRYRHFIFSSVSGEIKGRFARSKLGLFWSVLHPIAQAAIFALVLAEIMGAKLGGLDDSTAYPVYLLAGTAAWTLFTEIVSRSMSMFVDFSPAMKKISFPRICLPLIVWGNAIVNHFLLLLAILFVFLFFGRFPGSAIVAILLGAVLISILALGLGLILGVFNVFFRDISQAMAVVLQLWFWLTPVVYPATIIPEHLRWLLELNPLVPLVAIYQKALVFNQWPDITTLLVPAAVSIVIATMALGLFRRAGHELVDAL